MATIIGDNITSPLGFTTEENFQTVRLGKTALRHFDSAERIPFPFTASLFTQEQTDNFKTEGFTKFESLAYHSITNAIAERPEIISGRTVLVLSSTKGNVGILQDADNEKNIENLGEAARKISEKIGLSQSPIVVSNACISGVSAIILADRLIDADKADYVIVCGVDEQSPFIISGFESLKALSESECRPFDIERLGLNLGEAAATLVLSKEPREDCWQIMEGAIRNDGFHISSPSPKGEGAFQSLIRVIDGTSIDTIAVINAHGTATMYNDQMESKAISRAGLSEVPANALKGYFGHSMGAAGVLETVLTIHSVDKGIILGTRNFEELGVSGKVNLCSSERQTDKTSFVKMISGFGGGNASILVSRGNNSKVKAHNNQFSISHRVILTQDSLSIDGDSIKVEHSGDKLLTALYKERIGDYPKFYKMDSLSKLGFIASEILLQTEDASDCENTPSRGIAFFNSHASLSTDKAYLGTISDKDNYFPSPSLFVYTLPNIVTGELAIRHHYLGETGFYILPNKDWKRINDIIECMFFDEQTNSIIGGWVEYLSSTNFEANIFIANKIK
ncbi:MAG: 3-oxoacyl-ACP synthase [Muribaculum sp.]|nr:3-oxoacyl-ACP synthase [Muribaculum sp.]